MTWTKIDRSAGLNGESTITYRGSDPRFIVQSRKRAIPHANGVGSWLHTTYHLIVNGREYAKTFYSLADAKEAAEGMT